MRDLLVRAELGTLDWKKPIGQQEHFAKLTFIRGKDKQLFRIKEALDLRTKKLCLLYYLRNMSTEICGGNKKLSTGTIKTAFGKYQKKEDTGTPLVKHFWGSWHKKFENDWA